MDSKDAGELLRTWQASQDGPTPRQEATAYNVKTAVALALDGQPSALQGNSRMPVAKAQELAVVELGDNLSRVRLHVTGPWLVIAPVS